jgi:hypothetical protein
MEQPTLEAESLSRETAAELANLSYRNNQTADEHPSYQLDHKLSNRDHKVWTRRESAKPEGPKLVVGHRGTSRLGDWGNNLISTMGLAAFTARHKNAEALLHVAMTKHHATLKDTATVGHSAGGLVASHLNSRYNVQSHVFNPHIPLVSFQNYGKPTNHIYVSGKDPVSTMARFFPGSRLTFVKSKGKDHHSLSNFL